MKIDYCLVASDLHESYITAWPLVYKMWKKVCNIEAKLILVANTIPENLQDLAHTIILFPPIQGIHTAYQAQIIRIFYPALFENKNIIISDADIVPLKKEYFVDSVVNFPEDKFITYREKYTENQMYGICYNLANSNVWKEIFNIHSINDVVSKIVEFYNKEYDGVKNCSGWYSDQKVLYQYLQQWREKNKRRHIILYDDDMEFDRLDKKQKQYITGNLQQVHEDVKNKKYVDFHFIRPFTRYIQIINNICNIAINNYKYRVAVCISGAIRSFETCYASIHRYIVQPLNADVFLHLWSLENTQIENINQFKLQEDECSIQKVLELTNPVDYVIENYNAYWENKIITESKCREIIENLSNEKHMHYAVSAICMYYKIMKANELKTKYETDNNIKYDLVIRIRGDFEYYEYLNIDKFLPFYNTDILLIKDNYCTRANWKGNDKFFAGTSSTMNAICNMFKVIHKYYYELPDLPGKPKLEGQTLNRYHIEKLNLNIKFLGSEKTYSKILGSERIYPRNMKYFIYNCNTMIGFHIAQRLLKLGIDVYGFDETNTKNKELNHEILSKHKFFHTLTDLPPAEEAFRGIFIINESELIDYFINVPHKIYIKENIDYDEVHNDLIEYDNVSDDNLKNKFFIYNAIGANYEINSIPYQYLNNQVKLNLLMYSIESVADFIFRKSYDKRNKTKGFLVGNSINPNLPPNLINNDLPERTDFIYIEPGNIDVAFKELKVWYDLII